MFAVGFFRVIGYEIQLRYKLMKSKRHLQIFRLFFLRYNRFFIKRLNYSICLGVGFCEIAKIAYRAYPVTLKFWNW